MDAIRIILLVATVILFILGAWPISIITITIYATLTVVKNIDEKKKLQNLQEEIEQLKKQIDNLEKNS